MLRQKLTDAVISALGQARVVALLVPRQSGKTTLARSIARGGAFASDEQVCFWGVHNQAELDLLVFQGGRRHDDR